MQQIGNQRAGQGETELREPAFPAPARRVPAARWRAALDIAHDDFEQLCQGRLVVVWSSASPADISQAIELFRFRGSPLPSFGCNRLHAAP